MPHAPFAENDNSSDAILLLSAFVRGAQRGRQEGLRRPGSYGALRRLKMRPSHPSAATASLRKSSRPAGALRLQSTRSGRGFTCAKDGGECWNAPAQQNGFATVCQQT